MLHKGCSIGIPTDPFRNTGLAGAAADLGIPYDSRANAKCLMPLMRRNSPIKSTKVLDVVIDKRLIGVSEADLVDGDDVMVLRERLDYTTPVEQ